MRKLNINLTYTRELEELEGEPIWSGCWTGLEFVIVKKPCSAQH